MKETIIGKQIWSELLDIDIPGSKKVNGIRYYTWEQALKAAKKFAELYGKEWRLPAKKDFIVLAKEVDNDPYKLVEKGFVKAGFYMNSVHYAGRSGYYWSNARHNNYFAYSMSFSSGGVYTQNWDYEYNGLAVRCVKNLSMSK